MPEEYKDTKMLVMCNDCLTRSMVPFHVYGGKCDKCRSYNTNRIDDEVEKKKFEEEQKKKLEQEKELGAQEAEAEDGDPEWEEVDDQ